MCQDKAKDKSIITYATSTRGTAAETPCDLFRRSALNRRQNAVRHECEKMSVYRWGTYSGMWRWGDFSVVLGFQVHLEGPSPAFRSASIEARVWCKKGHLLLDSMFVVTKRQEERRRKGGIGITLVEGICEPKNGDHRKRGPQLPHRRTIYRETGLFVFSKKNFT